MQPQETNAQTNIETRNVGTRKHAALTGVFAELFSSASDMRREAYYDAMRNGRTLTKAGYRCPRCDRQTVVRYGYGPDGKPDTGNGGNWYLCAGETCGYMKAASRLTVGDCCRLIGLKHFTQTYDTALPLKWVRRFHAVTEFDPRSGFVWAYLKDGGSTPYPLTDAARDALFTYNRRTGSNYPTNLPTV
jgi:hypothetical protein